MRMIWNGQVAGLIFSLACHQQLVLIISLSPPSNNGLIVNELPIPASCQHTRATPSWQHGRKAQPSISLNRTLIKNVFWDLSNHSSHHRKWQLSIKATYNDVQSICFINLQSDTDLIRTVVRDWLVIKQKNCCFPLLFRLCLLSNQGRKNSDHCSSVDFVVRVIGVYAPSNHCYQLVSLGVKSSYLSAVLSFNSHSSLCQHFDCQQPLFKNSWFCKSSLETAFHSSIMRTFLLIAVAVVACAQFSQAAKCSDHLLALKADDFSEQDGAKYG